MKKLNINNNIKNSNLSKIFYELILPKLYIPEEIYFSCTGCGKCCRYEPGYVFLTDNDIKKITKYLKISVEKFLKSYTKKYNNLYSLIEKRNYDCIFWDKKVLNGKGGCSIYEARPFQCKSYPFWISVFANKKALIETSRFCPGLILSEEIYNEKIMFKRYKKKQIIKNIHKDFIERYLWYEKILKI